MPNHLTKGPSQLEIVTLAVFLLGGDERPIDTEDVAIKAHELAPTRFAWRKYPDQINLELVRVYLSDAQKKGGYVDGTGRRGWTLTAAGLAWARESSNNLLKVNLDRKRESGRGGGPGEQRWRRERERLLASDAWRGWVSGARSLPTREVEDVFRIDSYAVGRLRTLKVERLRKLFVDDKEIRAFLDHLSTLLPPNPQD